MHPILASAFLLPVAFLTWAPDPIFFSLGPIQVRYYGILFALALLAGYLHMARQFRLLGAPPDHADRLFLVFLVCVVAGARLGHVFFYEWDKYREDPVQILRVWEGGLASHGAAVMLLVGIWLGSKLIRTSYLDISDRLSGGVALGSSFVRIGNFFNSEVVGRVTDIPWAVRLPRFDRPPRGVEAPARHPSQLYEAGMGVAVWLVLAAADRISGIKNRPRGLQTFLFLGLYFTCRFLVEFVKEEQADQLLGQGATLTMGQRLSIPFLAIGWAGVAWLLLFGRRRAPTDATATTEGPAPQPKPAKKRGKKAKRG